eukprot:GILI01007734.1.p1 GENE.GILI01007734.1~~GILI01007734.1.p1  ORF type:complete len:1327 (-),score=328.72 GILI01007734.1:207-4187(-)
MTSAAKEYTVFFHLIEGREIKLTGTEDLPNPVCEIVMNNSINVSSKHMGTSSPFFDNNFVYEKVMLTDSEFKQATISIRMMSFQRLRRDLMIGEYSLGLEAIYRRSNHEMWKQWVALSKPDNPAECMGYVRVSITVIGPGDTMPSHNPYANDDDDEVQVNTMQDMVIAAPQLIRKGMMLKLNIFKGELSERLDRWGNVNPYVVVRFNGMKDLKTKVVRNNNNPDWSQCIQIPVYLPCFQDSISLCLYDSGTVMDDLVATTFVSFQEILKKSLPCTWVNFYTAPPGEQLVDKMINLMKAGKAEQCFWAGRLLLSANTIPDEKPITTISATSVQLREPETLPHLLWFDLYEVTEIHSASSLQVELCWGPYTFLSPMVELKNGSARWHTSGRFKEIRAMVPTEIKQVYDIIINVYGVNMLNYKWREAYLRIPAASVLGDSNKPQWRQLRPVRYADDDSKPSFGQILCNINFIGEREKRNSRPPKTKYKVVKYQLRAYIFSAFDLPPMDFGGTSDPFLVLSLAGRSAQTRVIKQTLNPVWNELIVLSVSLPTQLAFAPDLVIQVNDQDFLGFDSMGFTRVPCSRIPSRWGNADPLRYSLYRTQSKAMQSKLLAKFELIPEKEAAIVPIPPSIAPEVRECVVQLLMIGVRRMQPYYLGSVSSPTFVIQVGDSEPVPAAEQPVRGSNGNFNFLQTVSIPVKIPVSPIYCGSIDIQIFDRKPIGKVLLGTASVPLARYLSWVDLDTRQKLSSPDSLFREVDFQKARMILDDGDHKELSRLVREDDDRLKKVKEEEDEAKNKGLIGMLVSDDVDEKFELIEWTKETELRLGDGIEENNLTASDVAQFNAISLNGLTLGVRTMAEPTPQAWPDTDQDADEENQNERPMLSEELEKELKPTDLPYDIFTIFKSNLLSSDAPPTVAGVLKLAAFVFPKEDTRLAAECNSTIQRLLTEFKSMSDLVIRAYVMNAQKVMPKDFDGSCDPYIWIFNSDRQGTRNNVKDSANVVNNSLNPEFNKCYQLPCTIPDHNDLTIQLWDQDDPITGDDFIGQTRFDIEDRFMHPQWRRLKHGFRTVPIEPRNLMSETSLVAQGVLNMWLEILTKAEAGAPPEVLSAPKPEDFQIRLVIWNAKDVPLADGDHVDVMISCSVIGQDGEDIIQKTDVHRDSRNGKAQFNWRMIFNILVPSKAPRLKVQIWNANLLTADEPLSEAVIDMKSIYKKLKKEKNATLNRGWLKLSHPSFPGENRGQVELEATIVTAEDAQADPRGIAREEPNKEPYLETPTEGRSLLDMVPVVKNVANALGAFGRRLKLIMLGTVVFVIIVVLFIYPGVLISK